MEMEWKISDIFGIGIVKYCSEYDFVFTQLRFIIYHRARKLVKFNVSQSCCLFNKSLNNNDESPKKSLRIVGVDISNYLIWIGILLDLTLAARKRL